MFLTVPLFALILFSIYLVQGSSTNPNKRQSPSSSQSTAKNPKHARLAASPIFMDTSKETLTYRSHFRGNGSTNGNFSPPSNNQHRNTGSTSSDYNNVPVLTSIQQQQQTSQSSNHALTSRPSRINSPTILQDTTDIVEDVMPIVDDIMMQHPPQSQSHQQLNNPLSMPKSSRTRNTTFLQDATNDVEDILSEVDQTFMPQPLQSESTSQMNYIATIPNQRMIDTDKFYHHQHLPRISPLTIRENPSVWNFDTRFGEHTIAFTFFHANDIFSVYTSLSKWTPGQIVLTLRGFKQPYQGRGEICHSIGPAKALLTGNAVLPLCRLNNVFYLLQENTHIYMKIEAIIESVCSDKPVQQIPRYQMTRKDHEQPSQRFEELIESRNYKELAKSGKSLSDDDFLKRLCPVMKTIEHYHGLFECLQERNLLPQFFIHGNWKLIREAVLRAPHCYGRFYSTYAIFDAVILSFIENRHKHAVDLLEAVETNSYSSHGHLKFKDRLNMFFSRLTKLQDDVPLKRFLVMYKEKFAKSRVFEDFCRMLVTHLKDGLENPRIENLFTGLIGQRSLITRAMFAKAFFKNAQISYPQEVAFIKYAWKGAVQKALDPEYKWGSRRLWTLMKREYPNRFSGNFEDTDEWRKTISNTFPSKKGLEDEWSQKNAPKFQATLEKIDTSMNLLPKVLWKIVAEYAVTWFVV